MPASGNFLFVTWHGGGNINPQVELGKRLLTRGHHVRVLSTGDLRDRFESEGMSLRIREAPEVWGAAIDQRASYLHAFADELLAESRREPTDALLVDFMQPEALCAAERSGLPHAAFVHTLYTGVAIGPFTPMSMAADVALINEVRNGLGLDRLTQLTDLLDRASAVLISSVIEFDGAGQTPANVRFTGPLVEEAGTDAAWTPPSSGSSAPLVVVGLGTTPMNETPVLQRVLDALASSSVRVFATTGSHLDPASFDVPQNAIVSGYVRHAAVFPHADLFITHAGLSGVSAALTFSVPMLCLPLGRDQPANAARVEAIGAGRVLPPDALEGAVASAVTEMLGNSRYRSGAQRMATIIREQGTGWRAVDELERLLR